jgi:hypothetical protein
MSEKNQSILNAEDNQKSFFASYSDETLHRHLAVSLTSIQDQSPTVKNIVAEIKRRRPSLNIDNYLDTDNLIKYVMDYLTSSKVAEFCLQNFSFNEEDTFPQYSCLPLCVIDSIFSIGVKYEGVENIIQKVVAQFNISKLQLGNSAKELTTSEFLQAIKAKTFEDLARDLFNRQRTSSTNGILKAEAVVLFLQVLQKFNIEVLADVVKIADIPAFEFDIKNIAGQASGISLKYFYMLSGNQDLIKPDRMIMRFLTAVIGDKFSEEDAQRIISEAATEISHKLDRTVSVSLLDNKIWAYQRAKI